MVYWNLIPIRLSAQYPRWVSEVSRTRRGWKESIFARREREGKEKKEKEKEKEKKWNDKWAERWKSRSSRNGRNKIRVPFILEEIEKRKKKTRANSSVIPPDRNSTDRSRSGGDELSLLPCKIQGIVSLVCLEIEWMKRQIRDSYSSLIVHSIVNCIIFTVIPPNYSKSPRHARFVTGEQSVGGEENIREEERSTKKEPGGRLNLCSNKTRRDNPGGVDQP